MKKSLIFISFLMLQMLVFGMTTNNAKTGISLTTEKVAEGYQFTVTAPTEGWVSIGFDATIIMKDCESIILSNSKGKGQIYHYYGTGKEVVTPISTLDSTYKNDNLTLKSYSYDGKNSTYVFVRSEKVKNRYIKELTAGKTVKVLFAYSTNPDISSMHVKAASEKITLPN